MPSSDPAPLPPDLPATERFEATAVERPAIPLPISFKGLWGWTLGAGLLAGLLCWSAGEVAWVRVKSAATPKIVAFPTAENRSRMIDDMSSSLAVYFIQQAAILGGVVGLAGGLTRRKPLGGLIAALVGGGLGALAAAAAARGLLPVYFRNVDPQSNELTYPLLTHGGIWAAAGAAAGLAFGLGAGGRGRWVRCAVGGLLGGVFATMVYDLVGAFAFPLDKTSQPVSATVVTRLFAQFAVAVCRRLRRGTGRRRAFAPLAASSLISAFWHSRCRDPHSDVRSPTNTTVGGTRCLIIGPTVRPQHGPEGHLGSPGLKTGQQVGRPGSFVPAGSASRAYSSSAPSPLRM